ncbi:MAG: phosphoribosylglycinamide formyltransferase [Gammaproteobacteria bacterium]|nr:phosphoribosylglycinamide formyltransferase [Gammaproteobacteria bacterium]
MSKANIVALISGRGSNLQAVINATVAGTLNAEVTTVISNRPDVGGLEIAAQNNINALVIDHTTFSHREAFDQSLHQGLVQSNADVVLLAGFMRILTPGLVNQWLGKMINIHPSLLPLYPGLDTHARALASGDTQAGASVHFVTPQLDGGPVILQGCVPVEPQDTPELLAQRVLSCEHVILPIALDWVCTGRSRLRDNACYLDEQIRPVPVIWQHGRLHFDGPVRSSQGNTGVKAGSAPDSAT